MVNRGAAIWFLVIGLLCLLAGRLRKSVGLYVVGGMWMLAFAGQLYFAYSLISKMSHPLP
jgi:hypothetical protein